MTSLFNGTAITLEDILAAKEARVAFIETLTNEYQQTLVCFKLNMPGPVKSGPNLMPIFQAGVDRFREALSEMSVEPTFEKIIQSASGAEYFAVSMTSSKVAKRLTVDIETSHPLGRLFDFDCYDSEGVSLNRADLGLPARKCLICETDAFICGRNRTHDLATLQRAITTLYDSYITPQRR